MRATYNASVALKKKSKVREAPKDWDEDLESNAQAEQEAVDLECPPELLEKMAYQPEELIDVAPQQALLFDVAARWRVRVMHARMQADTALKATRAEEAQAIRNSYRASGEKLTEAALDEHLFLNKQVQAAATKLAKLKELEEYALLVLEALRMRRDSMLVLGMGGSAPLKLVRDRLREKYMGADED